MTHKPTPRFRLKVTGISVSPYPAPTESDPDRVNFNYEVKFESGEVFTDPRVYGAIGIDRVGGTFDKPLLHARVDDKYLDRFR